MPDVTWEQVFLVTVVLGVPAFAYSRYVTGRAIENTVKQIINFLKDI